jgi:hypothetical protein
MCICTFIFPISSRSPGPPEIARKWEELAAPDTPRTAQRSKRESKPQNTVQQSATYRFKGFGGSCPSIGTPVDRARSRWPVRAQARFATIQPGILPRRLRDHICSRKGVQKPYGMALELVYRAEDRCKSRGAPAGAFHMPGAGLGRELVQHR